MGIRPDRRAGGAPAAWLGYGAAGRFPPLPANRGGRFFPVSWLTGSETAAYAFYFLCCFILASHAGIQILFNYI